MSLYNVVFTALTPLIVGTMDSDVNREMSRKYPGPPHTAPSPRPTLAPSPLSPSMHTIVLTVTVATLKSSIYRNHQPLPS